MEANVTCEDAIFVEVRTVVGVEETDINEEWLAVAWAFPVTMAKPDGPAPIPTADERMSPTKVIKA